MALLRANTTDFVRRICKEIELFCYFLLSAVLQIDRYFADIRGSGTSTQFQQAVNHFKFAQKANSDFPL